MFYWKNPGISFGTLFRPFRASGRKTRALSRPLQRRMGGIFWPRGLATWPFAHNILAWQPQRARTRHALVSTTFFYLFFVLLNVWEGWREWMTWLWIDIFYLFYKIIVRALKIYWLYESLVNCRCWMKCTVSLKLALNLSDNLHSK